MSVRKIHPSRASSLALLSIILLGGLLLTFTACGSGEVTQNPTPDIVWQLDISVPKAYRAYRIPSLYPGVQW